VEKDVIIDIFKKNGMCEYVVYLDTDICFTRHLVKIEEKYDDIYLNFKGLTIEFSHRDITSLEPVTGE
jgi:hypothetical protein